MNVQRNLSLGCIVLLAIISLAVGVIAAPAQTAAPHTTPQGVVVLPYSPRPAPQAAKATVRPSPHKHRSGMCGGMRRGSPLDIDVYDNGPVNGQELGWTINFGFSVSNSMQIVNDTVTALQFWAWLIPGDTLTSVEVQIGAAAFGNELLDQTLTFSSSNCFSNQFGYNVCNETATFNGGGVILGAGTYWMTLSNASVPSGDPAYWDMNSGPSQAQENTIGTVPSESFTIIGLASTTTTTSTTYPPIYCVPEQSGPFAVIHDFTGNGDGARPNGVAIDGAGNLYGPTTWTGAGTVYKLAQTASSWVLNTLYNFLGGSSGSSPQGVIVGPHDILYGAAVGGLQNCNGGYCGLIFQLRPSPKTCPAISCSWTETVPYSFTGSTDAWNGGDLVFDQAGNLYGVSGSGGAQQQGAVFELTPTLGGWAESILYNFTDAGDGGGPTTLIVGNDGNLYGMTEEGGAYGRGAIFQLTPSAGGWNEVVLYSLADGSNLHSLQQDSAGNLFGIYEINGVYGRVGVIFELAPSNGNWVFTQLYEGNVDWEGWDLFPNMILDAAGNLRVTEAATPACPSGFSYAEIFELTRGNDGWQYRGQVDWDYTYWEPGGSLALDAQGNLYGTDAAYCAAPYRQGMVWELTSSHQ